MRTISSRLWLMLCTMQSAMLAAEYYSYTGEGNNLANPTWGASSSYFLRSQMSGAYDNDAGSMDHAEGLPSARLISTSLTLPSYKSRGRNARQLTDVVSFVGQLLKHDIVITKTSTAEDAAIPVPFCDVYYDKETCGLDAVALAAETPKTIPFTRSAFELDTNGYRQQVNLATAFIDGSAIYGHDSTTASKLRTYSKGKLLSYNDEIPLNTLGMNIDDPVRKESTFSLRAAGDSRANSHPVMLALHSLFVREHNRLADSIFSEDSTLSDEEIYQMARRWVVAFLQSICFYEFLPELGIDLPSYTGYQTAINPGIDGFFATSAFRFGHSTIYDVIHRIDEEGREIPAGHLLLHESFYHPSRALSAGIEPILRGATLSRQAEVSPVFSNALQNFLFGSPKHGGSDLLSLNIQRGRDHGMPLYNSARTQLELSTKTSFHEITSDYFLANDLESLYGTVDNMDAYVGGLAEDPYHNSSVGELFYTSIREQFIRLRDGDRFYFENLGNGLFTAEEVASIRNTGLRDIMLRNTGIQVLPENIYVRNASEPWPTPEEKPSSTSESAQPAEPVTITATDFLSDKASTELVPSAYTLEWQLEVIESVEYMRFTIICETTGWVALGFPKDASSAMVEADIALGKVESGVASVDDYWAFSFVQPVLDTSLGDTKDVELIGGAEDSGMTTISFRRRLTASDEHDRAISKTSPQPIIYAWHSTTDELLYHTTTNRGKTVLDLYGMLPIKTAEPSVVQTGQFQRTGFGGDIPVDALSDLSLSWNIVNTSNHKWLNATVRMKTSGLCYVAVGLQGDSGDLSETDLIKVESSGQYCNIHDSWTDNDGAIKYDYVFGGNDDLDYTYCTTKDGYIEAGFMRLTDTRDQADRAIVQNGYENVVVLWDRSDVEYRPQTLQSRSFKVDFFTMVGSKSWEPAEALPVVSPAPTSSPDMLESAETPHGEITLDAEHEYTLAYTFLGEDIQVQLSLKGTGFVGVGIPGADRNMHSADIIVAASDGKGGCTVDDYWSETFARPEKDVDRGGVDNLKEKTCRIEDGYLKAGFVRSFGQGDEFDRSFAANSSLVTIIYAFHTSSEGLQYHGSTWRGVLDVGLLPEGGNSQELLAEEFDDAAMKELTEGYTVWWKVVGEEGGTRRRAKSRKLLQEAELEDDSEIIIKLQRKSVGWMGFGIDPADASVNGMQDTDMYIGWISADSSVTILDAWSVGFMMPESDSEQGGQNSVLAYAGQEEDGVSTIVFKRKINTGDSFDRVIKPGQQDIVFAYGDGDGLPAGGHGPCCRGKTKINWDPSIPPPAAPKTPKAPNENLKKAHGWMMIMAWAIFAIIGVMVSHIGRHWKYWVQTHVFLEVTAVLLSSLGEIVSLSYTEGTIRGAHGALFFLLLFTMFPQLLVGYFMTKTDKAYMKKIHRGIGYFILGVACWQMWLGMKLYGMDTRFIQCFYAWLISVGVALNFAAESVPAHDFKAQLSKKGVELEENDSKKKKKRSSSKAELLEKSESEVAQKVGKKGSANEPEEDKSFSIKTSKSLSRSDQFEKDKKNNKARKGNVENIEAYRFMEACAEGKQWTVINEKVYDMTQMVDKHPGGPEQILDIIGKDGSELYNTHHGTSERAHKMLAKTLIGTLIEGLRDRIDVREFFVSS